MEQWDNVFVASSHSCLVLDGFPLIQCPPSKRTLNDGKGSSRLQPQPQPQADPNNTMPLLVGFEPTPYDSIDGVYPGSVHGDDTAADAAKRR